MMIVTTFVRQWSRRSFHLRVLLEAERCSVRTPRCIVADTSSIRRSFSSSLGRDDDQNRSPRVALVLGSSGALGSVVTRYLSRDLGMLVVGVDILELPGEFTAPDGWELDEFIEMPKEAVDLAEVTKRLTRGVHLYLRHLNQQYRRQTDAGGSIGLDAIVCANGGWQGDPDPPAASDSDDELAIMEQGAATYANTVDRMRRVNLDPVVAAGYVAQHYMAQEGLMVVMGATAALAATPGMLGYGLSKASAHHFIQTMGSSTGKSLGSKSERKVGRRVRRNLSSLDDMSVVGILPTMIDTPANRKADPKGDFQRWTKPLDIAKEIGKWIETPPLRPHSGSLVRVYTPPDGSEAVFELVR